MALCRIKNIEQLKKTSVGEFGKLLGLDRIPQVEYLREKIRQITDQKQCDWAQESIFKPGLHQHSIESEVTKFNKLRFVELHR